MVLLYKLSQAFLQDMSIDLGRGDVGMAQQLLHNAQVGTPIQ
jgi:hypothetical protein